MQRTVGGPSSISSSELHDRHVPLAHHLVAETMRRVPSSVTIEELTAPALAALAVARRTHRPDSDGDFAAFARMRIQAALVDTLRSIDWSERGRRTHTPARPERLCPVRTAVAMLPGDRRAVVEGYFLHERTLPELAAEFELDESEVEDLRTDALRSLQRTLAPVMMAPRQAEWSSSGSSGTGSPRTLNLR